MNSEIKAETDAYTKTDNFLKPGNTKNEYFLSNTCVDFLEYTKQRGEIIVFRCHLHTFAEI